MEVETVDEREDVVEVRITGANPAVANTLRRAMVSEVPTLAIKHLDIVKNESGIFDELLANRVGQIPFEVPGDLDEDDKIHVAANVEGEGQLVASDIQTDRDLEPVNPDALIVDLKEGQSVEFEGEAVLGSGSEHAKHQGGTVGYEKVDDGEFVFRIESTSGYSNEELFEEAVEEVKRQLDEFMEAVDEL